MDTRGAMDTRVALARACQALQRGENLNLDENVLHGIDCAALGSLAAAPQAICSIGTAMCASLRHRDFALVEPGQPPQPLLRQPGSFRATMVQISGEAHDAFQEANGNMQQLGLWMGTVPESKKTLVSFLADREMTFRQMERHFGREMGSLAEVADKCLQLAKDTHQRFERVGTLVQMTQELVVAAQAASHDSARKAKLDRQLQEMRVHAHEAAKQRSREAFATFEKNLRHAQTSMQEAMDTKPGTDDIIGACFAETGCVLIRSIGPSLGEALGGGLGGGHGTIAGTLAAQLLGDVLEGALQKQVQGQGGPSTCVAGVQGVSLGGGAAGDADEADLLHHMTWAVTCAVGQKVTEAQDRVNSGKQLRQVQEQVARIVVENDMNTASELGIAVSTFGKELQQVVRKATDAVEKSDDHSREEALGQMRDLLKKAQSLVMKKQSILPSMVLPPAQPFGGVAATASAAPGAPQAGGDDGGVAEAMVSGWKFQMQATGEVLKQAAARRDAELKALRNLEQKSLEENEKLARINIEELSVDGILQILSEVWQHNRHCQEAWARLIEQFHFIKELTAFVCEKQLPEFVKVSQNGHRIVGCLKDQLYQMVVKVSTIAHSCCYLAKEYHSISKVHFMPALSNLGTIYALADKSPEMQPRRAELLRQCADATRAIKAKVEERQRDMPGLIQGRMAAIENEISRIISEPAEAEIPMLGEMAVQETNEDPSSSCDALRIVGVEAPTVEPDEAEIQMLDETTVQETNVDPTCDAPRTGPVGVEAPTLEPETEIQMLDETEVQEANEDPTCDALRTALVGIEAPIVGGSSMELMD